MVSERTCRIAAIVTVCAVVLLGAISLVVSLVSKPSSSSEVRPGWTQQCYDEALKPHGGVNRREFDICVQNGRR